MTDSHSVSASPADDEPETPFWLPALGFVLFIVGGVAWAVTPPLGQATPPEPAASAKAAESASAAVNPAQAHPPPAAPAATFAVPSAPPQPVPAARAAHDESPPPAKPTKKHP
jgi:hypothetical protein